ncbi:telomere-protecting terminal protein Tpg [Kitasatospora sp. NPDC018058]|uniref:telomere-protecting terminal protein Tpg n=1 Tax=Kitasatospora sp. NPDC018058 TaxID=3364025 RepID=UPI0037BE9324
MDEITDGLERALRTRPIPRSVPARVRVLVRAAKGSTAAVAAQLGVSQRTVQRWLKGQAVPKPAAAEAIERAVTATWQPRVRARQRRAAIQRGITVHTSAQFGYTSAAGSTDDPRLRQITQHLPGETAGRLLDAHAAGAGEQELEQLLAQALGEHYFRDGGRRAGGLDVELTGVQWADVEIL